MMGEAPSGGFLFCAIVFTAIGFALGFWVAADECRVLIVKRVETAIQTIHGDGAQ